MSYLLDTHALLWSVFEPDKMSSGAQALIRDPRNEICVSTISFWEISLKYALGKLTLICLARGKLSGLDCSQRDAMQGANCAAWVFSRKQFATRQCARWGQSNRTISPAQGISQPDDLPGIAEEMGLIVIAPNAEECAAF